MFLTILGIVDILLNFYIQKVNIYFQIIHDSNNASEHSHTENHFRVIKTIKYD